MRRLACVVLTAGLLAGCGAERLSYDPQWTATEVLAVIRHETELALVGIDAASGKVYPLKALPEVRAEGVPEAAVLRTPGGVLVSTTEGADPGTLFKVDIAQRSVAKVGELSSARLPSSVGGDLVTVGGALDDFQLRSFAPATGVAGPTWPLKLTPITGDGRCLVGVTGTGQDAKIMLVERPSADAAGRDLGSGTPGGVACADGIAAVTVAAQAAEGQQPPADTRLLLVSGSGIHEVTVGRSPRQVALNDTATLAAVIAGTGQGTAVQTIEVSTGKIVATTALSPSLQPEVLIIRQDKIFILGGTEGAIIPLRGGAAMSIALPGPNVTTVWRS